MSELKRFSELCDLAHQSKLTSAECMELESLCQLHPELVEEWLDMREPVEAMLFGEVPRASENFQASTMARIRADRIRRSATYWAPSAIAAVAACLGVFLLLQSLNERSTSPAFKNPNAEASLERSIAIPIPDLQEPLGK